MTSRDGQLRRVGRVVAREYVGTPASVALRDELLALQREAAGALDVAGVLGALLPALEALASAGHLCSVSVTRDGRCVRLAAKIGGEWAEWYASEAEWAEELSTALRRVLSPPGPGQATR